MSSRERRTTTASRLRIEIHVVPDRSRSRSAQTLYPCLTGLAIEGQREKRTDTAEAPAWGVGVIFRSACAAAPTLPSAFSSRGACVVRHKVDISRNRHSQMTAPPPPPMKMEGGKLTTSPPLTLTPASAHASWLRMFPAGPRIVSRKQGEAFVRALAAEHSMSAASVAKLVDCSSYRGAHLPSMRSAVRPRNRAR